MSYNMSFTDWNATLIDLAKGTNDLTGTALYTTALFVIWLIIFAMLKHYNTKASFVVAFFVSATVAVGFYFLTLIHLAVLITVIIGLFLSILYYLFGGD
jgi:hypothetical protein